MSLVCGGAVLAVCCCAVVFGVSSGIITAGPAEAVLNSFFAASKALVRLSSSVSGPRFKHLYEALLPGWVACC